MYDKHLDCFMAVAECGSFSKAAEKAFLSPNAIIKQINILEADLDIRLFDRTNRGAELTEAGKSLYQDAKRIVRLSNQAVQKAKQIELARTQAIRIGTSLLRPCKTIIELWSTVSDEYPNIKLQIVPCDDNYRGWIRLLDRLGITIDIAAGIYPSTLWGNRCQVLKLEDIPLCCAVSRKNPLSEKKKLKITDLYKQNLLMVERGDTSYIDALRDVLEQDHPQIHIQDVPSYDTEVFNQCADSNSIMISIATWSELHPSLVTIPVEWDFTVPYGIIYSKQPTQEVLDFIEIIRLTALSALENKGL